jgi:hypothetical protein
MIRTGAIDAPELRVVQPGDVPRAVSVQTTAFSADPVMRRHGFEVIREIRVGASPPVTPMIRLPR